MALRIAGFTIIGSATPGEDPVTTGYLWADTLNSKLKQATSISPYVWTEIGPAAGASITPADTVTTLAAAAGTAGVAATYSRSDHRHPITYGTIADTFCQGNDSRLSDSRTPTAHAASHVAAGSDPLTLSQSQITGLVAALATIPTAAASVTSLNGTTSTVGVSTAYARQDHVHAISANPTFSGTVSIVGETGVHPSGVVVITDSYAGDGLPRAAIKLRRDTQDNGGTPTIGDGVEYLCQLKDDAGNYGNIAGIGARLVTVAAATMKGRLELNAKNTGAFNAVFDECKMIVDWDGKIGIGTYFGTITNTPAFLVNVVSDTVNAASVGLDQSSDNTTAPSLVGRKSRGTKAVPTKTLSGDDLLGIVGRGYQETTGAYGGSTAAISFTATEDFTSAAQGSKITLAVTPTGSLVRAVQMTIAPTALTLGSMVSPAGAGTVPLVIDTGGVVTSRALTVVDITPGLPVFATTLTVSQTIASGQNATVFQPITIPVNVTVTIAAGGQLDILSPPYGT